MIAEESEQFYPWSFYCWGDENTLDDCVQVNLTHCPNNTAAYVKCEGEFCIFYGDFVGIQNK